MTATPPGTFFLLSVWARNYKETIKTSTKSHGRYKHQTGGHGAFGDVYLDIKPLARGEGYAPIGEFSGASESDPELQAILTACVLCNDALLQNQAQEWSILGDPTEGALLTLAGKGGLYREALTPKSPRLGEFPFSSERKRMSVICENAQLGLGDSAYLMFTKGSPELILERCSLVNPFGIGHPLFRGDHSDRLQWK